MSYLKNILNSYTEIFSDYLSHYLSSLQSALFWAMYAHFAADLNFDSLHIHPFLYSHNPSSFKAFEFRIGIGWLPSESFGLWENPIGGFLLFLHYIVSSLFFFNEGIMLVHFPIDGRSLDKSVKLKISVTDFRSR